MHMGHRAEQVQDALEEAHIIRESVERMAQIRENAVFETLGLKASDSSS